MSIKEQPKQDMFSVSKQLVLSTELKIKLSLLQRRPSVVWQVNPQHTVPTIVDHGKGDSPPFALWESGAIMTYLVNKTDPNHKLYPANDLKTKAIIDRWLHFDLGSLYASIAHPIIYPVLMLGVDFDPNKLAALEDNFDHLEDALSKSKYLASDNNYTLADLSIFSSLTLLELIPDVDFSEFTHLVKWYTELKKELPYFNEVHQQAIETLNNWAEQARHRAKANANRARLLLSIP